MHDAFVLAAGLGTRLRPLTLHRPKALVPVCGVPMLAYSLALAARHGLRDVIVNAHHLAGQVEAWAGEREGVRVTVTVESPDILGTGGGLKAVADRLAERFVVLNADVLADIDCEALLAAVPDGGAALALRMRAAGEDYGTVAADAEGAIVRVRRYEGAPVGAIDASTHFTGVYAMHRDALSPVPPGFQDVVDTAFAPLIASRRLVAVRHGGLWLDVGDPAAYLATNLAVLSGAVRPPLDPLSRAGWGRRGGYGHGDKGLVGQSRVEGDAWIGAGAVLAPGSRVTGSIVGERVWVPTGADLVECVVWDGATVEPRRYERAILHDGGVLHVI